MNLTLSQWSLIPITLLIIFRKLLFEYLLYNMSQSILLGSISKHLIDVTKGLVSHEMLCVVADC